MLTVHFLAAYTAVNKHIGRLNQMQNFLAAYTAVNLLSIS